MFPKYLALLGLAQKAGKIVTGDMAVQAALAHKRVKLLLIAADASAGSKAKFRQLADRAPANCVECATKAALGASLGKGPRAAVAILDQGLATAIHRALAETTA